VLAVGEIAARAGRKLCLLGRSLLNQREVAEQIGRLRWPPGLTISPEQAATWPRDELIVLAAGTQAESTSSMLRLASGTHQHLAIEPGDTVILSSRAIPGNERPVFMMMMEILRRGAVLHTRHSIPALHTSGHAGQSEQRRMIELVRPRAFLPVHGTLQHLLRHAELARNSKVRDVVVVENGTSVVFDERGLRRDERVPWGKVAIAQGGEPISAETLRRRAELGRSGMATVSLALDRKGGLVSGPSVSTRGIPGVDDEPAALRSVARAAARVLERGHRSSGVDLSEEIRRAARRELFELCGCRPVVEVHLLGPHD
jgi:ribonuclease J